MESVTVQGEVIRRKEQEEERLDKGNRRDEGGIEQ